MERDPMELLFLNVTQSLTVKETAKALNLGVSTTYKAIAEGNIKR